MGANELPSCLLPLRIVDAPKGQLVCIHPGGLAASHYQAMAEAMPGWSAHVVEIGRCPQYWQAPAGDGAIDRRADHMIDHIADVLRSQLPAGPLVLCGWSFGGVIAHVVASRWHAPAQIKVLAMLDSIAPHPGNDLARDRLARSVAARWFVQYLNAHKGCSLRLPWWPRATDEQAVLGTLLHQAAQQGAVHPDTSYHGFRKVFTAFTEGLARNGRLAAGLSLRRYDGRTLLFRARRGLYKRFTVFRRMGWTELTAELELSTVPSDHYSLLTTPACMHAIGARIAIAADAASAHPRTFN